MINEQLKVLSDKALSLPLTPGVYIMKNKSGKIIYIGKAKNLKNRVSQYFRPAGHDNPKVQSMVDNVFDFDYILCTSEFEALILEMTMIKQHKPKYNILLKDDKGYHYVKISPYPWRKIIESKQKEKDGSKYLGPYNSGYIVKKSVEEACKVFQLPTCNLTFGKGKKSRPCLNYSIGLCCAPCAGKIKLNNYEELVNNAIKFINGDAKAVIDDLKSQMEQASDNLEFELAARLRDRIIALKKITENQNVYNVNIKEQDIIASAHNPNAVCYQIFHFIDGKLFDREHYIFNNIENTPERFTEFIMQYYSLSNKIPKQITLNTQPSDSELLKKYLSEKSGRNVILHVPQKGQQLQLVKMCADNAAEQLILSKGLRKRNPAVLDELTNLIGLKSTPNYIESYDISHTAGQENVAGMVVFKDAKPYKKAYKRFKIKGFVGQDDYESMAQVLSRRFEEYEKSDSKDGFGKLPDLILLDGGKGQLSAVLSALDKKYHDIPIFGMVKDSHHKTRALVGIDGEIQIKQTRSVFTLISTIQDEVHRFSVEYHRKRISKKMVEMELTRIKGIGEKRAALLLKNFGTVENIKNASLEELEKAEGMTKNCAQNVFNFYKTKK